MELIWKAAAAALLASAVGLLLRRHNPEAALLLGALTAICVLSAALGLLNGLRDLRSLISSLVGKNSETLILPVFKCMAVTLVTRFAVELCRDAAQNSVAAALEVSGSACCLALAMPLLISVLKTLGGLT